MVIFENNVIRFGLNIRVKIIAISVLGNTTDNIYFGVLEIDRNSYANFIRHYIY